MFLFTLFILTFSPAYSLVPYTVVCTSDSECREDASAYCDLTSSKCACREEVSSSKVDTGHGKVSSEVEAAPPSVGLFLINSRIKCLSGKALNTACSYNEQCHLATSNSHCANATICKCIFGFLPLNGSCHNLQEKSKNSSSNEINLEMLPIMIVLGLMFIGMCVALNMFSRARFRNQRGVFTAPRNAARALKEIQVKKSDRRYSTRPSIVSEHLEVVVDAGVLQAQVTDCQTIQGATNSASVGR